MFAWPAQSHHLKQCWSIVDWALGTKLQWKHNRNLYIFIQENAFENIALKMAATLSEPQCLKIKYAASPCSHILLLWWIATNNGFTGTFQGLNPLSPKIVLHFFMTSNSQNKLQQTCCVFIKTTVPGLFLYYCRMPDSWYGISLLCINPQKYHKWGAVTTTITFLSCYRRG